MQLTSILFILVSAGAVAATPNEPCYGPGGSAGVCVTTAHCTSTGGTFINGACPWDTANVKCCSKPRCRNGPSGNCRWASDCAGSSSPSNLCPGPAAFKCCNSSAPPGGYPPPRIPTVGACKKVAVDGAKKIVAKFPGRVREIGCKWGCPCTPDRDHCCGKATDIMCSDSLGAATMSGREIAEWVMNNRATLKLKYVIWGQKIWDARSDTVKPWNSWKLMEDRHSITQNHWDHVHVSYR
ncbi:hypothetical protein FOPG_17337 [Fusarium oxysporum f. sp. conglutinans race 2 54008]|uniref:ARB-07466-like C-terminal domain-containing protein n=1 Tax=Fusarium oxysporum f. sp. conglutinans race 2 54008 TaxID=1089457 RepID=X0H371_FUSOX|nr:hypothetical protein FOPG_17337 [Fusarium oxysporum f. sp. conglutinans race 2 54008]